MFSTFEINISRRKKPYKYHQRNTFITLFLGIVLVLDRDQKQLREEKVYLAYTSTLYPTTEGSQGWDSSRDLKAKAEAEAVEKHSCLALQCCPHISLMGTFSQLDFLSLRTTACDKSTKV